MNTMPKYKIGQTYISRGKAKHSCTVVDILKTYNSKDELVKIRYVATHKLLGQIVTDNDVVETTITMGLLTNS